jgi:hypothetical protein
MRYVVTNVKGDTLYETLSTVRKLPMGKTASVMR